MYQDHIAKVKVSGSLSEICVTNRKEIYIKPLAQAICQDGELRGVAVRNRDHRISPCTDDMMMYFMDLDASF